MKHYLYVTTLLLVLFLACISTAQQPAKLTISGDGIQPLEFTKADLTKMPRLSLDVSDPHSGENRHYEGVRLSDLLAKAAVPLGDKLKGKALATYVLAQATDGYAVVFSLAELDPAVNDNRIIVADTMDGKQLDQQQGPFRVVVPGEKRPARWIRMVILLKVLNAVSPSGSLPR